MQGMPRRSYPRHSHSVHHLWDDRSDQLVRQGTMPDHCDAGCPQSRLPPQSFARHPKAAHLYSPHPRIRRGLSRRTICHGETSSNLCRLAIDKSREPEIRIQHAVSSVRKLPRKREVPSVLVLHRMRRYVIKYTCGAGETVNS